MSYTARHDYGFIDFLYGLKSISVHRRRLAISS